MLRATQATLALRARQAVRRARAARPRSRAGQAALEPGPLLRPLPRRGLAAAESWSPLAFPAPRPVLLEASVLATARRALLWLAVILAFVAGNIKDALRGRASRLGEGERLFRLFQWGGGTFTKLGQQLSVRI